MHQALLSMLPTRHLLSPSLPPYRMGTVILPGFVGWTLRHRDQIAWHGQSQGLDPGTLASEAEPANPSYTTSQAGEPSFEVDTVVPPFSREGRTAGQWGNQDCRACLVVCFHIKQFDYFLPSRSPPPRPV